MQHFLLASRITPYNILAKSHKHLDLVSAPGTFKSLKLLSGIITIWMRSRFVLGQFVCCYIGVKHQNCSVPTAIISSLTLIYSKGLQTGAHVVNFSNMA